MRKKRVSRRKITWLTIKLCKDIINDIVNGMETAISTIMMKRLVEEVVIKAEEVGIVKDVEEHGQNFRNMVEDALKSRRRAEEAIL